MCGLRRAYAARFTSTCLPDLNIAGSILTRTKGLASASKQANKELDLSTLPQTAIDVLPFSAEPMFQWKKDADIRTFLNALYPAPLYPSFGSERFAEEERVMREYARSFTKNLMEVNDATIYLDFYQDARFGQIAKYTIALECCIQSLLEDAGFYSLAHVLESESDMKCSLLLASNFYYKQAIQMLRNILEEVFLPIHFCDTVKDFDAWKANNYRTPKLRGNDGLIKRLLKKNIFPEPLAMRVADLYGNLSAYVHGSQSTLIHQNIHLGEMHHIVFHSDMFSAWGELFCECAEVCIRLLKINYDQWHSIHSFKLETLAKVGKTLCNTCHNEDAFDRWLLPSKYCFIRQKETNQETNALKNTNDIAFNYYICQRCGNTTTINANETPLEKVYCFSDDDLPSRSAITDYFVLVRGTEDPYCEWYAVQIEGADINITSLLVRPSN